MEIKTFRARTMQEALNLVRRELGPEATVLHTRELNTGLIERLYRARMYEIAATAGVSAATTQTNAQQVQEAAERKTPAHQAAAYQATSAYETAPRVATKSAPVLDFRDRYREAFRHDDFQHSNHEVDELQALAQQLRERGNHVTQKQLPEATFEIYTDLIESDIEEPIAQQLVEQLRESSAVDMNDLHSMRSELVASVEGELRVSGPIDAEVGQGKVVALVGPTGVGKTTTIAKLAANYRLRENKRVGLITVDTYRIAAVEQLRTYAEIIDLPMEIVSTPREMREAIARMSDLDLILMDTAGRSPRDEVKIQELKSMLAEAEPDEVHLVLSAVGGARSLVSTAKQFATVGTTAMLITKLDEATALGNLLSVTRNCDLPISYLTDGQNVPDDIQVAQPEKLAQVILGVG